MCPQSKIVLLQRNKNVLVFSNENYLSKKDYTNPTFIPNQPYNYIYEEKCSRYFHKAGKIKLFSILGFGVC